MKRNTALTTLSREHHTGLLLAQILKKDTPAYKGMPSEPSEKIAYLLQLMQKHLEPHFTAEEKIIAFLNEQSEIFQPYHQRILQEHQEMRLMIEELKKGNIEIMEAMDNFAHILEKHIRFEEREYFQFLQDQCSAETLLHISKLSEEREP